MLMKMDVFVVVGPGLNFQHFSKTAQLRSQCVMPRFQFLQPLFRISSLRAEIRHFSAKTLDAADHITAHQLTGVQ